MSILRRTASLRGLLGIDAIRGLPAALFLQAAAEEILHLGIDAPHVVVGPAPQGREHLRIDPQQEGVAGRHGGEGSLETDRYGVRSVVERAGVDDWLGVAIAAEDDEEIRYHRCLALVVELDDLLPREMLEGHLHHGHGPFDNL